jgi:hypothetical protein
MSFLRTFFHKGDQRAPPVEVCQATVEDRHYEHTWHDECAAAQQLWHEKKAERALRKKMLSETMKPEELDQRAKQVVGFAALNRLFTVFLNEFRTAEVCQDIEFNLEPVHVHSEFAYVPLLEIRNLREETATRATAHLPIGQAYPEFLRKKSGDRSNRYGAEVPGEAVLYRLAMGNWTPLPGSDVGDPVEFVGPMPAVPAAAASGLVYFEHWQEPMLAPGPARLRFVHHARRLDSRTTVRILRLFHKGF